MVKPLSCFSSHRRGGEPLVWYQLDKHDNDPAVFLQYLAAGFRRVLCGFNIEVPSKGSMDQPSSVRSVTAAILRELAAHLHGEMLLVIDGYEAIEDPAVHALTEDLINLLPLRRARADCKPHAPSLAAVPPYPCRPGASLECPGSAFLS